MSVKELDNLVKIGQLKAEPFEQSEFDGLLASGRRRLVDAGKPDLSAESRFDLAYNAAHALALAALRRHGYRPNKARFVVFQALAHTLALKSEAVRLLAKCHGLRNLAEYEGAFEADDQLLRELLKVTSAVRAAVEKLGPVPATRK